MQKIGDITSTANANGEWMEGNPAAGLDATLIKSGWLNTIQRELIALVLGAGLPLNKLDDSQVLQAVRNIAGSIAEFKVTGDGITDAGLVGGDQQRPYIRDSVTKDILLLQRALGFTPARNDHVHTFASLTSKPTTLGGYGISDAYTISAANAAIAKAISDLVASSPGALDTLNELAQALGNDPNFATTVTNALAGKANKSTTLAGYGIIDSYTRSEANNAISASANTLVGRDGISTAGLVGGDQARPYMRDQVTGDVLQLQRRLGFDPVQQGGGIGQAANKVYLGMSNSLNRPAITVDTTNFGGVAFLSDIPGTPPITKEFGSAPQIVSNGGLVALAHGLGVVPKIITGELICVTAENGWTVGDIQHISLSPDNDDSGVVTGFAARKDATNIYARCGTSGPYGVNINNGTTAVPNAANWRLVLRAFA
ncbi:hypothetical protein [Pseudomonas synxantha]|uniref:Phage tail fiber protein n=1 Tax=Pseudomonas synxantha TaxID=47883 RepID=A0AAU8TTE6_9PSED|nr:hypothetical protein [Pseudomonas synxantha]AKA81202.1 Phage tail fiber protein [Pseudomonas synxantha]